MTDDLQPTSTTTPTDPSIEPVESTTVTNPADSSPTTEVLAADVHAAGTPADDLPAEDTPQRQAHPERPLLSESQWARQRAADEQAALDSLDETVLRPALEPVDLGQTDREASSAQQARRTPPNPSGSTDGSAQQRPFRWKLAYAIVACALVGWLVAERAAGMRSSNVGLFGVTQQVAQEAVEAQEDSGADTWTETESETGAETETWQESEPEPEADPEPVAEVETDAGAESEIESETEADPWQQDDEPSYTYHWYDYNPTRDDTDYDDSGTSSDGSDSSVTVDDEGITYTFDGGSMSYRYGDEYVTFEIDDFDRLLGSDGYGDWGGYGSGNYGGHPRGW